MAKYYVGVDGGGTRCRMCLADTQLNMLAEVSVDRPSNLQVRNGDAAYEAITQLTAEVFAEASLPGAAAEEAEACFGMAGGRLESARISFAKRAFPFARVSVFDDIDIARAGAHRGEDGAVLIIGTGSAGLGIFNGERHQVGGWGFHVGDTMSGAVLGRELLRRTLVAHEGLMPGSPLTERVMADFGDDLNRMMDWSFNNKKARTALEKDLEEGETLNIAVPARPADYGQFVPLIFEYGAQGDPVASELLAFQLEAIDMYVGWFRQRGAPAIAIVGGLGTRLLPRLQERYGSLICEPRAEPLEGAVILARQLAG